MVDEADDNEDVNLNHDFNRDFYRDYELWSWISGKVSHWDIILIMTLPDIMIMTLPDIMIMNIIILMVIKMIMIRFLTVCDDTQNVNETESETFFRYRIRYFFRYQIFSIPNPILFLIPNFFDTESETIKKMEKFRNREVSKPKRHTLIWMQRTLIYYILRLVIFRPRDTPPHICLNMPKRAICEKVSNVTAESCRSFKLAKSERF